MTRGFLRNYLGKEIVDGLSNKKLDMNLILAPLMSFTKSEVELKK